MGEDGFSRIGQPGRSYVMRTMSLLKFACVGVLLAACADDEADADPTTSVPVVPTSHVVVVDSSSTPPGLVDAAVFVDDCVAYVPVAAFTGNPYMQIIWAMANQNPVDLRAVCEGMV